MLVNFNKDEARWQSPIGDAPELTGDEIDTHVMSGMKIIKVIK